MKKLIIKKITFFCIVIVMSTFSLAGSVKEFYITCNPDDYDYMYSHPDIDYYIPITLTLDGKTWTDVKMRIRGDDTRALPKKSLKINFGSEKFENGIDKFNFNAEYEDRSYMCQYLASRAFNNIGYPCFKSEHARLYLNGKYLGLYLKIENMDEEFLDSRGMDPYGNLYKAFEDDACLSIFDDVYKFWEKETNDSANRSDLIQLIDSINLTPDAEYYDFVNRFFDYDKMITVLAMNMLIAHGSTYYHNYYMYHDINKSGKWIMLPWDMDKAFYRYGYLYPYHRSSSYSSPDNPLLERAILDKRIFSDIKTKIDELVSSSFNNEFFDPIIDSLTLELESSINEDVTDYVDSIEVWFKNIPYNKEYVTKRPENLKYQFENYPTSFKVEYTNDYYTDSVKFIWHTSTDPKGGQITYDFYFGNSEFLDKSDVTIIKGLTDTTYLMKNLPADGLYYWKVTANNGVGEVDGFNYPNPVKIIAPTQLPCSITADMRLTKDKSPYSVNCDIEVSPNTNLSIEKGVEIIFKGFYQILIKGSLNVNGTHEEPVKFYPDQFTKRWKNLYFHYTTELCRLRNFDIYNGTIFSQNSFVEIDSLNYLYDYLDTFHLSSMFFDKTNIRITNSNFQNFNPINEGLNIFNHDNILVENCTFKGFPDAIEYIIVKKGVIKNNIVYYSNDDCIDVNGCEDVLITGNKLYNAVDKGISVGDEDFGTSKNIRIERNIVSGCESAVSIKDGSNSIIINNTFYKNHFGVYCYEKRYPHGGGRAEIKNTIISKCKYPIFLDVLSSANAIFCISDTLFSGSGNIQADPMFVDHEHGDYRLKPGSPCIDAGDPDSPLDPDGTRADIGAIPSGIPLNLPRIVINEINYKSANDFDSGDWVEFYNAEDKAIDMSGWLFSDGDDSHRFIFPANFVLNSGAYVVVCRDLGLFTERFPLIKNNIGEFGFGLSGDGDIIRLFDEQSTLIDSVSYGVNPPWSIDPNGNGHSLELIDPAYDNTKPESWTSSKEHGTPGKKNGSDSAIKDKDKINYFSCTPNPIDRWSELKFGLFEASKVNIVLYNSLGQTVKNVYSGDLNEGNHSLILKISEFSEGIYYCRLQAGNEITTIVLSHLK